MTTPAVEGLAARSAIDHEAEAPGALALVEAFVNTYDTETDAELFADAATMGRWLARHDLVSADGAAASDDDLARVVAVREALRDLLRANHDRVDPPAAAVAVLERESRAAPLSVVFADGHASFRPVGEGVDRAVASLLAIVWHAMHDGSWPRLKICSNDECAVAFWDASRNRSGRWCSMAVCGNRAKVASYRQRHADD